MCVLARCRLEERAVGVVDTLLETQRAFDSVAPEYHRANADNPILSGMRRRARAAVEAWAPRGSRLLDLGCGPGTDAEWLAARGYRITAIDWSPAMTAEARHRVRAAALEDRVEVRQLGIQELDRLAPDTFDAAYSNFGPLNCVADLAGAARLIADRLRPRAALVASVIGRVCPWELALYLSRGAWARALVRYSRGAVAVPLDGRTVWTQYFSPRELTRIFAAAGFERVALRALGAVVPPPYLQAFAGRHPRLLQTLESIEDGVGGWPVVRGCGDHFLIVFRKA
jgi:SAM-dependent methyltransferase